MQRSLLSTAPRIVATPENPAHVQIERWLTDAIDQWVVQPGERLPGERVLSAALGVSRMTLRQAMNVVEQRGLIRRQPGGGGGAFVTERSLDVDLTSLAGLSAHIVRANMTAGAQVVSATTMTGEPSVTAMLGLAPGDDVHEVLRVRLANGEPVVLERSYFPVVLFPDLLDKPLTGSMYAVLRESYGHTPTTATEYLRPVSADEEHIDLLKVEPGSSLLTVERTAYDAEHIPVEYSVDVFRADRIRLLVRSRLIPDTET